MPTICDDLARNARRVPDRDALVAGQLRMNWATVAARVASMAAVLHADGLKQGDRCALLAPNCGEFVLAAYAILCAGGVLVPVNSRLAPPEVDYILEDSGAARLVSGETLLELVAADAAPADEVPTLRESDNAIILYTSGTTGRPKGVLHDHHRLYWAALAQLPTCGLQEGERYLHVAPLYHAGGITSMNAATILAGTQIVLSAFEPATVLETIERERATVMFGVPTMYQMLLRHPDLVTRDLSSFRIGVFGAAPMPSSAVEQMLDALPQVRLVQQCGQTEAGPSGIYQTPEQVRQRPDVSGFQAMPFCEVRVVDAAGRDIAPGETGEMLLSGESVMKGYWGKPTETAEVLGADGWLHTGDVTRLDADGSMTIVDRMRDVIITGGRNVYSVEVENAVASHPSVSDCAVIGRPQEEWGESIVAVVTTRDGSTLEIGDLREHCRSQIADYKLPHHLVLADIPRNPSGKVLKRILRQRYATGAQVASLPGVSAEDSPGTDDGGSRSAP